MNAGSPMLVWPPAAWLAVTALLSVAIVTALLIWSRRLTGPTTPDGHRRWRAELQRRLDAFEREAAVAWWSALNDGLLGRAFRRRCVQAARSSAVLHGWMSAAVRADARLRTATRDRALLGPATRRPYLPAVLGLWVFPAAAGWADWVLTKSVMEVTGLFDKPAARVAAIPTALGLVLAGRAIGAAIRDRKVGWAAAGVGTAIALGSTLAVLQAAPDAADPSGLAPIGAVSPRLWLVIVLAPVAVSAFGSFLSHVERHELEVADHALRLATWAARWTRRGLARSLTTADGSRAELAAFVAARLVARPHAAANGETPPIEGHDVIGLLAELGVVVDPTIVRRGHELLDRLATDLETHRPTHLRSAA